MKIWRSYGSAHSANLTVIGEFKKIDDAESARAIVKDFVDGDFKERYPDIAAFCKAWSESIPGLPFLGPNDRDFKMGIDSECDVERHGTTVSVSGIRTAEIGGILKLMLLKDSTQIKVTGKTGP